MIRWWPTLARARLGTILHDTDLADTIAALDFLFLFPRR
jgi:hypothetical protein